MKSYIWNYHCECGEEWSARHIVDVLSNPKESITCPVCNKIAIFKGGCYTVDGKTTFYKNDLL